MQYNTMHQQCNVKEAVGGGKPRQYATAVNGGLMLCCSGYAYVTVVRYLAKSGRSEEAAAPR